jgi:hypothetical protein
MLAEFTDLPLELLPAIFETIRRPSTLATICLVSRTFYNFTIPLLYERIFIYPWQKEGKRKVGERLRVTLTMISMLTDVPRFQESSVHWPSRPVWLRMSSDSVRFIHFTAQDG